MDLQALAAVGEFVGGIGGLIAAIAVVASLVFVGIQIKASVKQASVDSYSTITTLWTNFTNAVAANDESWAVFYGGMRDYDSLTDKDKARFNFLIGMYFGIQDTVMVHKDLGVKSALELDGAAVCTNTGTTTELNVSDYFRANNRMLLDQ